MEDSRVYSNLRYPYINYFQLLYSVAVIPILVTQWKNADKGNERHGVFNMK